MRQGAAENLAGMDARVVEEAVAFIRLWLPERAKSVYRALIAEDTEGWRAHPHFAGGIVVDSVLRGNGLTEQTLGVVDLNAVWPDLLALALLEDDPLPERGEVYPRGVA